MNSQELTAYLSQTLKRFDIEMETTDMPVVRAKPGELIEICKKVKTDNKLRMECLHLLSVVDYDEYFEVVYHLYSYAKNHMFAIKVKADRTKPVVPSVFSIWKGADYQEREGYDLFGVKFEGHPNLKRLLLTPDWEDHPMRRDYVLDMSPQEGE